MRRRIDSNPARLGPFRFLSGTRSSVRRLLLWLSEESDLFDDLKHIVDQS